MFYTTTVCDVKHIDSKKCSLLFGLFIYINIYIFKIYIYIKNIVWECSNLKYDLTLQ